MRRGGSTDRRVLTTVLFTDIVRSTERAQELGDRRWHQVLSAHHRVVRRALKAHGGREIDTAGDGFFATFGQPSDAIACAFEAMENLRPLGIEIRAGVHMGEVELTKSKVSGITVHVGARLMARADAGQVLVSSTVRDLMTGADIAFVDEGFHELKGVASQVHVYAVRHELPRDEPREPTIPADDGRVTRRTVGLVAGGAVVALAAIVALVLFVARSGTPGFIPAADTVVELDPADGSVMAGTRVGTTPTVLAFDGTELWVANFDDKTVQRVNVDDATAGPAQGGVLGNPTGLAAGEGSIWVTNGFDGHLVQIDPGQSNAAKALAELGSGIKGVAFGAGAVWVASPNEGALLRVDPQTGERRAIRLGAGSQPEDVAVGPDAVWVADAAGGRVFKIDPATDEVGRPIPLLGDRAANRIAFGEGYVWVTSTDDDSVTRIDPSTDGIRTIEGVGNGPLGVAAGNGHVWVANSLDGTVAKIDPGRATIVGRTSLGFSPDSVALSPNGVWVSIHSL